MLREHTQRRDAIYKLAFVADEPYEAASMNETTVMVTIAFNIELLLRNSVVPSPVSGTKTLYPVNYARQQESGTYPCPFVAKSDQIYRYLRREASTPYQRFVLHKSSPI